MNEKLCHEKPCVELLHEQVHHYTDSFYLEKDANSIFFIIIANNTKVSNSKRERFFSCPDYLAS